MAHSTYYTSTGKRVPSVTTILGVLDTPALKHWAWSEGQQGRHYDESSKAAMWRGTLIHLACELDDATTPLTLCADDQERHDVLAGFGAWTVWSALNNVSVDEHHKEVMLVSDKHMFGGTCDMVAMIDGVRMLIDIKTGKGIYPNYIAQQAAYAVAWREQRPDEPLWGVGLLHINGVKATLHSWPKSELMPAWSMFRAAKEVYGARSSLEAMVR